MKTRISQVIVYVSDMQQSTRFYRDLLGLTLVSESEQWSEFDAGPFHLGCTGAAWKTRFKASR